ncbi:MAG: alkaline phosphatase family protein [Nitrospiraceae bacterium]|nr:alkaline phosphatase family protein [Nitrospiraceae bacterium]
MSNNRGRKIVIIGLDGVPFDLLTSYMEQGIMPRMKEIASAGSLVPMRSTLPEVSSVAWASFMTGRLPAEHSIFGFMEIDKSSYQYTFPNFLSIKSPMFWESLDASCVAFNIPQTYPARPLKGVLVSGFVSIDLAKAVYPRRVYDYLKETGYRLDVNSQLAVKDPEAFFEDLFLTLQKRAEAMRYLYDAEEWEIFIGTITETDRLHHFFFDCALDGKWNGVFADFYRRLDGLLFEMFTRAQKDGAVFMTCSDHGFATIKIEVYVNRYLAEKGYLDTEGSADLSGIKNNSAAFCLDPSRVYIHSKDKYARGGVDDKDYERVRNEIKGLFSELTFSGRKVVKKVFLKEEIFSGPFGPDAPDLYILGEPGFDLKASMKKTEVFGLSSFRGAHTYEGAHFYVSGGLRPAPGLSIDQIAKLVREVYHSKKQHV